MEFSYRLGTLFLTVSHVLLILYRQKETFKHIDFELFLQTVDLFAQTMENIQHASMCQYECIYI